MDKIIAGALFAASLLNLMFIAYAHRNRSPKGGVLFYSGGVLCSVFYAAGYAFELLSDSLDQVIFWLRVEYIGIVFFPAFWMLLVLKYTDSKRLKDKRWLAGLFLLPVISLIAHYTNGAHHLFYAQMSLQAEAGLTITVTEKGILYWLNLAYMYVTLLYGDYLLLRLYPAVAGSYKSQLAGLLLGSFLPFFGNFLYLVGLSPGRIDLSPFMIALATPIYGWSLFRVRLFDLVPIARDRVFEGLHDGVLVLDLCGRLVDYNPAAKGIFPAVSAAALGGDLQQQRLPTVFLTNVAADAPAFEFALGQAAAKRHYQVRMSPVVNGRSRIVGKIIVLSDISENVRIVQQLHSLAMIDETTQIYNRRNFMQKSQVVYKNAKREQRPVAMVLFDIDYFKRINDTYGHSAGDAVLYGIAQCCRSALAAKVVLGRYGGEEFCFCLSGISRETAFAVADRIRQTIAQQAVKVENDFIGVTASFGIAFADNPEKTSLQQLLKEADQAMYSAKAAGRNRVAVYKEAAAGSPPATDFA